MSTLRMCRHLLASQARTRMRFPAEKLQAIEAGIAAAEARTSGEIRFVIETALEVADLWSGMTPRDRAIQTFSDLHVWNTELRNGVLIYVLVADRDVEILADRGAAALIPPAEWEAVCRTMEDHFKSGRFAAGALAGVEAVGGLLERRFPRASADRNELPNQPALL
jgi:uncharacterized membrane protein